MEIEGKVVVVTGGASGIGRALAQRFSAEGAAGIVIGDLDEEWANNVAEQIGATAVECDVADPKAIGRLVAVATERYGPVDIFCSNAGYHDAAPSDLSAAPEAFEHITAVNLLAHVWAAREVLPSMVERGGGYLLQTLSSAALLAGPAGPGYTLSKQGALGFAEWVSLHYGHLGVRVSCLCPNEVYTGMMGRPRDLDAPAVIPEAHRGSEMMLPEDVALEVVEAMRSEEPFLILPHSRVGTSFAKKAADYDAWLDRTRERLVKMMGGA
jgi:NAD(P)-dependent dehydrogenase (short-subunit alcohol dehydrogenase family)